MRTWSKRCSTTIEVKRWPRAHMNLSIPPNASIHRLKENTTKLLSGLSCRIRLLYADRPSINISTYGTAILLPCLILYKRYSYHYFVSFLNVQRRSKWHLRSLAYPAGFALKTVMHELLHMFSQFSLCEFRTHPFLSYVYSSVYSLSGMYTDKYLHFEIIHLIGHRYVPSYFKVSLNAPWKIH